jgi:flagella basal body P-ring formation protein FlgA
LLLRGAIAAVAALLCLRAAAFAAAGEGRITLGDQATIAGKTIRLSELGDLEGSALAFSDLDLGPAPEPGVTRRLAGATVLRQLRVAGFDPDKAKYEIPTVIRITRAAQDVGESDVRNAILADAQTWLAPGEGVASVEVSGIAHIGLGPYEARVSALRQAVGPVRRLEVEIVQDGSVVATLPARVAISARGDVVVAKRPIARGTIVAPEDIGLEERSVNAATPGMASDPNDVVGKEARVALLPGSPIELKALEMPAVVKRGDRVTLVIETAGLRLRAPGEALESATTGARVRVMNTSSKRELSGQVIGHGLVSVEF